MMAAVALTTSVFLMTNDQKLDGHYYDAPLLSVSTCNVLNDVHADDVPDHRRLEKGVRRLPCEFLPESKTQENIERIHRGVSIANCAERHLACTQEK